MFINTVFTNINPPIRSNLKSKLSTVENLIVMFAVMLCYLLGAIPSGLLLTRLAGHGDIRLIGSGNIGATNVLRTGNKLLAAATLVFDILKGTLAVLMGSWLAGEASSFGLGAGHLAGLAAFIGHLFPVWLGFKGGKGVATYIGVLAGLFWPAAIVFCLFWLAMAAMFRYSSLSALASAVAVPIVAGIWADWPTFVLFALLSVMLIAKHDANIRRLINGREPKIGEKS